MLTHTEFFYEVWAEKIRSKPVPPYGAPPKGDAFCSYIYKKYINIRKAYGILKCDAKGVEL